MGDAGRVSNFYMVARALRNRPRPRRRPRPRWFWRSVPPSSDLRPSVLLGSTQRRRTRPLFEDEDENESLQLGFFGVP
jgi:hypothetical protein